MEMRGHAGRSAAEVAADVQRAALRRGLIVELGGREDRVVRLLPPLNITVEIADQALAILAESMRAVEDRISEAVAA
jgi:diaminobutyrate-2-oxoglutarate transaminase